MTTFRRVLLLLFVAASFANYAAAQAPKIETSAAAGKPFGVGVMTVTFPEAAPYTAKPDIPYAIHSADSRVLYPAFKHHLKSTTATGDDGKEYEITGLLKIEAYFLFRGEKPLELTLDTPDARYTAKVAPETNDALYASTRTAWWAQYCEDAQRNFADDAYPPLIENYLMHTLARRMSLKAPKLSAYRWSNSDWTGDLLALMTGAESVRIAMQKKTLLERTNIQPEAADQPLPKAVLPTSIELPKFDDAKVVVEPIAKHVPEECFYVRCGSYANFRWLRNAIDQWGTQIRDLSSVRAVDYHTAKRLERQLAIKETTLGRLLGSTVIEDVAIIGTDTFVREGAAIGILFQAKSNTALSQQLLKLQHESENITLDDGSVAKDPTWRLTTKKIGEGTASYAHTPDNRVRSFYVVDGDYHLVTTSRTIARRFLEAGRGQRALADLKEFRYARSLMPVANEYETFVYLSDPFFRLMVSPQYRVEMTRRMKSAAEMDMIRVALLAAQAEGVAAKTIDDLIGHDLLPKSFGKRPDGSNPKMFHSPLTGLGIVDTDRGAYGSLLPVPDAEVGKLTQSEVRAYKKFSEMYRRQWERMDPVIIGLQHEKTDRPGVSRVVADVHISPYPKQHYGRLSEELGKPLKQRVSRLAGDIVSIEANVKYFSDRAPILWFGRLQDFSPRIKIAAGKVDENANDEFVLAYAGFHKFIFNWLARPSDREGPGPFVVWKGPPKVWGMLHEDAGLIATRPELLTKVAAEVKPVDAERPAQMRLRIADLQKTKVVSLLHAYSYTQARRVSAGNSRWLNMLNQQLGIEPKDALAATEKLLEATPTCPLGGKYSLETLPDGRQRWISSAWRYDSLAQVADVPKDYRSPLLEWFAELELDFQITPDVLMTHIELEMRE